MRSKVCISHTSHLQPIWNFLCLCHPKLQNFDFLKQMVYMQICRKENWELFYRFSKVCVFNITLLLVERSHRNKKRPCKCVHPQKKQIFRWNKVTKQSRAASFHQLNQVQNKNKVHFMGKGSLWPHLSFAKMCLLLCDDGTYDIM